MKQTQQKPTDDLRMSSKEFDKVMRGLVAVPKPELVEAEKQHRERMRQLREKRDRHGE